MRIRRTDLTEDVAAQTYERMRAERLAEAEGLRANGQVAAREIRAAADREVSETVAGAQRDSQILQGEGDAERNAIFAAAFGADPEFFEFYRSMQAYRGAMENAGTTMVLSPDSDFFRFFNSDVALAAPSAPVNPVAPLAPPAPAEGAQEETEAPEVESAPLSPAAEEARARAEEAARAITAGEEPPSIMAPVPGSDVETEDGLSAEEPETGLPPIEPQLAPSEPAPAN